MRCRRDRGGTPPSGRARLHNNNHTKLVASLRQVVSVSLEDFGSCSQDLFVKRRRLGLRHELYLTTGAPRTTFHASTSLHYATGVESDGYLYKQKCTILDALILSTIDCESG